MFLRVALLLAILPLIAYATIVRHADGPALFSFNPIEESNDINDVHLAPPRQWTTTNNSDLQIGFIVGSTPHNGYAALYPSGDLDLSRY